MDALDSANNKSNMSTSKPSCESISPASRPALAPSAANLCLACVELLTSAMPCPLIGFVAAPQCSSNGIVSESTEIVAASEADAASKDCNSLRKALAAHGKETPTYDIKYLSLASELCEAF